MKQHVPWKPRLDTSPRRTPALKPARVFVALTAAVPVSVTPVLVMPVFGAQEMAFRSIALNDHQVGIVAVGQITGRTPEAFRLSLDRAAAGTGRVIVILDSPGGSVQASMELGTAFRNARVRAVVARVNREGVEEGGKPDFSDGECFSACVYALMGARERIVPPQSRVGIHRMAASDESVADERTMAQIQANHSLMRSDVIRYAARMGVDPAIVASAERTAPQALHILSQAEIRQWRLGMPR